MVKFGFQSGSLSQDYLLLLLVGIFPHLSPFVLSIRSSSRRIVVRSTNLHRNLLEPFDFGVA